MQLLINGIGGSETKVSERVRTENASPNSWTPNGGTVSSHFDDEYQTFYIIIEVTSSCMKKNIGKLKMF